MSARDDVGAKERIALAYLERARVHVLEGILIGNADWEYQRAAQVFGELRDPRQHDALREHAGVQETDGLSHLT